MKLKKALLVCLLPAFVISGCGKTTTDETENTTKQESAVEETVQDEQETGDTETESKHPAKIRTRKQKRPKISLPWIPT